MQAYCVKCHAKRKTKKAKAITTKHGKPLTHRLYCFRHNLHAGTSLR